MVWCRFGGGICQKVSDSVAMCSEYKNKGLAIMEAPTVGHEIWLGPRDGATAWVARRRDGESYELQSIFRASSEDTDPIQRLSQGPEYNPYTWKPMSIAINPFNIGCS